MTAYYILMHTITDVERYQKEYIPATGPILAKYKGEVVAATFNAEPLQGEPPGAVTILRFPSEEAARTFVNDPEYKPLKKIRLEVTKNSSAVLVPEFKMPGS